MKRFNGLLDAIFLPPRNWVLNNALKFIADLTEVEISKLNRCDVKVKDNGEVTVPAGYITDLASVPRIAWAVIAPFDVARAAVVHDILYEKINGAFKKGDIKSKSEREEYRAIADKVFKQGMEFAEPKVAGFKIWSAYNAVRIFGRWAINSSAPRGAKPKK
jgi:hypothetical protein